MSIAFARLGRLACLQATQMRPQQILAWNARQTSLFGLLAPRSPALPQPVQLAPKKQPTVQEAVLQMSKQRKIAVKKRRKRKGDRQISCRHR